MLDTLQRVPTSDGRMLHELEPEEAAVLALLQQRLRQKLRAAENPPVCELS